MLADWVEAMFLHFRVSPHRLQSIIPLELDLFGGDAFVSLVAFTQRRLRPSFGGQVAAWLSAPLASHEFFNVRTYVRHGDDRGIFFLAEWIPNRVAVLIGPRTYGLPYRLGRLDYHNEPWRKEKFGQIKSGAMGLMYRATPAATKQVSLDQFLLERYTAFTHRDGVTRRFDVDHVPWPHSRVEAELIETNLLRATGDWHREAEVASANYSPGVADVAITAPRLVTSHLAPRCRA